MLLLQSAPRMSLPAQAWQSREVLVKCGVNGAEPKAGEVLYTFHSLHLQLYDQSELGAI